VRIAREIVGIGNHQIMPSAKDRAAFLAGLRRPCRLSAARDLDGAGRRLTRDFRQSREDLTTCRIDHIEAIAALPRQPFAPEIGRLAHQSWI
jgi:hypothetical protein